SCVTPSSSLLAAVRDACHSPREPIRFELSGVEPLEPVGRTSSVIATRRTQRALLGIAAAGISAVVLLLGGVLSGSPTAPASAHATPSSADAESLGRLLEGFSTGNTAAYVRMLERRIAAHPRDADAMTLLGLAYQQRAR